MQRGSTWFQLLDQKDGVNEDVRLDTLATSLAGFGNCLSVGGDSSNEMLPGA